MNVQTQVYNVTVEARQVDEAVLSLFHTILFYRSNGKHTYQDDNMFSIGSLGWMDVDCEFFDFTYVRCNCPKLDETVKRRVAEFSQQLLSIEGATTGQISLEFFERRRTGAALVTESVPWEVWTVRVELMELQNENDWEVCREKVGTMMSEKLMHLAQFIQTLYYLPETPCETDQDLVFDTSYADVQPYLFQFRFTIDEPGAGAATDSVGNKVKKMFTRTLEL